MNGLCLNLRHIRNTKLDGALGEIKVRGKFVSQTLLTEFIVIRELVCNTLHGSVFKIPVTPNLFFSNT